MKEEDALLTSFSNSITLVFKNQYHTLEAQKIKVDPHVLTKIDGQIRSLIYNFIYASDTSYLIQYTWQAFFKRKIEIWQVEKCKRKES